MSVRRAGSAVTIDFFVRYAILLFRVNNQPKWRLPVKKKNLFTLLVLVLCTSAVPKASADHGSGWGYGRDYGWGYGAYRGFSSCAPHLLYTYERVMPNSYLSVGVRLPSYGERYTADPYRYGYYETRRTSVDFYYSRSSGLRDRWSHERHHRSSW